MRSKSKMHSCWTLGRWDQKWVPSTYPPFLHHRLQRLEIGRSISFWLQTVWLWRGEVSISLPLLLATNCIVMVWRDECLAFHADYKLYGYGVDRWVSCCLYCRLWTVMVWRCEHTYHSLNIIRIIPTTQLEIPNALCKVPVIQSVTYTTKVHWSARKHRTPL